MSNPFFEHPILNSPYACPLRHWELDGDGQPTQQIIDERRKAQFISPIPKPKKRKGASAQQQFIFDEGKGLSTEKQQYDPTPIINELRQYALRTKQNPIGFAEYQQNAQRAHEIAAMTLHTSLSTRHFSQVTVNGVDVFHPNTGEVRSDGAEGIACWFIDTDYNGESFFVRQAYFLGANDPYSALKTTLKAEINEDAWATLNSDTSRPVSKPLSGRIAVNVINHLGDEVMKVFKV